MFVIKFSKLTFKQDFLTKRKSISETFLGDFSLCGLISKETVCFGLKPPVFPQLKSEPKIKLDCSKVKFKLKTSVFLDYKLKFLDVDRKHYNWL